MKRSRGLIYGLAGLVVVLDQLSKHWAVTHLPAYGSRVWLPGLVHFQLTTNTGAAFSLLSGSTLTTETGAIKITGAAASGGTSASGISIGEFSTTGTISATGSTGSILLSGTGVAGGAGCRSARPSG